MDAIKLDSCIMNIMEAFLDADEIEKAGYNIGKYREQIDEYINVINRFFGKNFLIDFKNNAINMATMNSPTSLLSKDAQYSLKSELDMIGHSNPLNPLCTRIYTIYDDNIVQITNLT